jgi:3-dehydroquinate synthase
VAAGPLEFELRHERGVTRHRYGAGALERSDDLLGPLLAGRRAFAVSSAQILALWGHRLEQIGALAAAFDLLEVADGEAAKCVAEAEGLWRRLAAGGGKRDSVILAFGGGSVGDLAGFVAGAFLRGVDWIQLPTTLLAQVDAAVGGKTAVDLPEAKNAVGLFHHPRAVVGDAELLSTLPPDQVRSGLVEAVKTAALLDPELFERIECDLDRLRAGEAAALAGVAAGAARRKAELVESDPSEAGRRALLNLGHTLGHALEAEIGFGRISHGDAVAHGLRFALRLSVASGGDPLFAARVAGLLDRLEVPALPPGLTAPALAARIGRDKKGSERGLVWVLLDGPGRGRLEGGLPAARIEAELARWLAGDPSL